MHQFRTGDEIAEFSCAEILIWCSNCQEYIRSEHVLANLERLGPNIMAYVLYARYCLRLPYNKIKQIQKGGHCVHPLP